MGTVTVRSVWGCLAAACLLASCSSGNDDGAVADGADAGAGAADTPAAVYPAAEWERADAAEAGFDEAKLDEIAVAAEQAGSNCLVVVHEGRIVDEHYWRGTTATSTQEVFSATKSYASTLVGIAQAEGHLSVDDPAAAYIDAWAGTPSAEVTIENLLSNDSGRRYDAAIDYGQLPFAADMDALAIGLDQQAPPGTTWAYNNSAIQTLDTVIREATGTDTAAYAADKLFAPLGMAHSTMTKDAAGNTKVFMGLQSSCEDMARFGYLFLRDGNWDGTEVVPPEWVEAATGDSSQDLNSAYGYLWWLNRPGRVLDPARATTAQAGGDADDAQLVPGAPDDMYFALGLGDQIIAVDPGSETVVVRLGGVDVPDGAAPFGARAIARVVTDAYTGDPDGAG
ncbi:MAG TPA: serine hydrolase [Acidimicrobiales bacterium]|nr:serine hydrolase [Acidimicrobiales bacterium]